MAIESKNIKNVFVTLIIALVFLFNANINIIDFFPDIIGYIILSFALVKLSYLSEDIYTAAKYFKYMIISEIAKVLVIMWVFGLSHSDVQNTGILLAAFVFAMIEATLLFLAFNSLFEGLISLGFVHNNTAVLGSKKEGGRSYTEKIRSFTLFFVIFKAAMSVLPEFSNLASYEYDESAGFVDIYEYIGLMRAMSFVIVTVVGVVWFVKIIRYFSRLAKDSDFCASLTNTYLKDILPKRGLFIKRNVKLASLCFLIGAVCMIDFRIEYISIIPDILGAVAFLIGFLVLFRETRVKGQGMICGFAALYTVFTITAYVVENIFFNKYYYGAIYRNTDAYRLYCIMCGAEILSVIGFALVVAGFVYAMNELIKTHTGFVYGNDMAADTVRLQRYHRESSRKLIFPAVAAVLLMASDIFYSFFAIKYGFAGFLNIAVALVFVASVVKTLNDILDDVETKYMLE